MLLDVKLVKSTSMYCTESAAATVATFVGRNYEMMFSKMWGFKFDNEQAISEGIIGKNLYRDYEEKSLLELLEIYHGIRVEARILEDNTIITDIIIEELLNNMPVLVFPYSKHCPWLNNQSEFREYVLIIGYEKDYFYCLDVHNNTKEVNVMFMNDLKVSYEEKDIRFSTFRLASNEKTNITANELYDCFKESISLQRKPFIEMSELADCIETNFDYKKEKDEFNNIPITSVITDVCRSRKLLASTFSYIAKLTNDKTLENFSFDFYSIGGEWNIILNLLVKAFFYDDINKKTNNKKVADRIRNIAIKEENLINSIINNKIKNNKLSYQIAEKDTINISKINLCNLNISNYLNDLIFDQINLKKSLKANDFSLCEILPDNKVVNMYDIDFKIYNDKNKNDNICCNKQILEVNQGIFKRILFLGCSFWGNGCGYVNIIYADDYVEKLYVDFPDWYYNSINDVPTIWTGNIIEPSGKIEKRSLFCLSFVLEHNQFIKKIILPDNNNIHIFSIAFEKI